MKSIKYNMAFVFAACLLLTQACTRKVDVVLPGPPDASVNFYNASEVLSSPITSGKGNANCVFVDDSTLPGYVRQMQFYSSSISGEQRVQPAGETVVPVGLINQYFSYEVPAWLRVSAGNHRVIFTGSGGYFVADTTLDFPLNSLTSFYLAESPESDDAYRLLAVPEKWAGLPTDPSKVLVRFIDCCPDLDELKCYRVGRSGEPVVSAMHFGTTTSYISLDIAGVAASGNLILLRLFTGKDTTSTLLSVGIPAAPGASYVVLVQGFYKEAVRRVQIGVNANGTRRDTLVTVSPRLRMSLRRTY